MKVGDEVVIHSTDSMLDGLPAKIEGSLSNSHQCSLFVGDIALIRFHERVAEVIGLNRVIVMPAACLKLAK